MRSAGLAQWKVEQSHMIDVPRFLRARDVDDLKRVVRLLADKKEHRPVGELMFQEEGEVIRVGFVGDDGKKRRFLRLRRWKQ